MILETLTLLKKRSLTTNVSAANQPPKILHFNLSLFPKEDRAEKQGDLLVFYNSIMFLYSLKKF